MLEAQLTLGQLKSTNTMQSDRREMMVSSVQVRDMLSGGGVLGLRYTTAHIPYIETQVIIDILPAELIYVHGCYRPQFFCQLRAKSTTPLSLPVINQIPEFPINPLPQCLCKNENTKRWRLNGGMKGDPANDRVRSLLGPGPPRLP